MNNISSIKSLKTESPKTPGGISKSLLTPCRRIGLSRNHKRAGPAPFISPLSGNNTPNVEVVVPKKKTRKRKKSVECEENEEESETTSKRRIDKCSDDEDADLKTPQAKDNELSSTPTRHVEVPSKRKSKTLLSSLSNNENIKPAVTEKPQETVAKASAPDLQVDSTIDKKQEDSETVPLKISKSKRLTPRICKENAKVDLDEYKKDTYNLVNVQEQQANPEPENIVTTLQKTRTKSNSSKKCATQKSPKTLKENVKQDSKPQKNIHTKNPESLTEKTSYSVKPRSPNDLSKECIVVIQKKIFKTDKKKAKKEELATQPMFDSDSDDVPLKQLHKESTDAEHENTKTRITEVINDEQPKLVSKEQKDNDIINLDEENEDFEPKKTIVKKLEDKATSIGGLKKKLKSKPKPQRSVKTLSMTDCDDEDDFDFENKKTILIRKTYQKMSRPQKAKSTGSITQHDIDELKARIESKKKLLLARTMTEDTEELRSLIKKWQKGCQDALMELMELMKTKFPDKQNMDYSEMLSMLKIPTNLVGYDEENDCFNTPDDANIILSSFGNL